MERKVKLINHRNSVFVHSAKADFGVIKPPNINCRSHNPSVTHRNSRANEWATIRREKEKERKVKLKRLVGTSWCVIANASIFTSLCARAFCAFCRSQRPKEKLITSYELVRGTMTYLTELLSTIRCHCYRWENGFAQCAIERCDELRYWNKWLPPYHEHYAHHKLSSLCWLNEVITMSYFY